MAKALTQINETRLSHGDVRRKLRITLNGSDITSYCTNYNYKFSTDFSIASLDVELVNNDGIFSENGSKEIFLDDKIIVTESFLGTSDDFVNFTGYVRQRRKSKTGKGNFMSLTCLDLLVKLEDTDIEHHFEANKISVTNETLTPNPLEAPNAHLSQIYNFANKNIAEKPIPLIRIYEIETGLTSDMSSGFEIYYETGQIHFGSSFNFNRYTLKTDYSYYPISQHVEEIIEDIISESDGYDNFLFNEASAADVVTNHLTDSFLNVEGLTTDTMVPNLSTQTITISVALKAVAANASYVTVEDTLDTTGFPSAGTGNINGETFVWTSKTSTTLIGSVTSAHAVGSYVNYKASYLAGTVWYLAYSNLTTTLAITPSNGDFTVPGATILYFDKRQGRIILDTDIDIRSAVTCDVDYSFKTIQATGIQISDINFTFRKDKSRLDCLKRLQEVLAPNYVFQTLGNEKIWGRFLTQKAKEDFTLKCKTSLDFSEDTSIYTRTRFYGKNENPVNVCWQPNLAALVTGETFTNTVDNQDLTWKRKEGNFQVYIAGESIKSIITTTLQPRVRVNGVLINDELHEVLLQPMSISEAPASNRGEYWTQYIRYNFAHRNIDRNHNIVVYQGNGTPNPIFTNGIILPNNSSMNYEEGSFTFGPISPSDIGANPTIRDAASADYWIHWSSSDLIIDFEKGEFKISTKIVSDEAKDLISVTADFEYKSIVESIYNADYIKDGRWDTQAQTVFWTKPASGFIFFRLDLGDTYKIQIIDLVAGFFRPDENSKIRLDMTNTYTLQYSLDNITYYDICKKAIKFSLGAGEAISLEIEDLGEDFKARYFQIKVIEMSEITYRGGCWVVAFTDFACYSQSILIGEAKLTPYTELSSFSTDNDPIIYVDDTSTFDSSGTAYIENDVFSYTAKTATSFTGCSTVTTHVAGSRVSQKLQSVGADTYLTAICAVAATTLTVDDTSDFAVQGIAFVEEDEFTYTALTATSFTGCSGLLAHGKFAKVIQNPLVYDTASLLKMKDKVYKDTAINEYLSTQEKISNRAYNWLREFIKDHSKCSAQTLFGPHLRPGMTIQVEDSTNNISSRYFIEAISVNASKTGHPTTITMSKYP